MKKIIALFLTLLLLTQAFSAFALVKRMDIPIDSQAEDKNALHRVDSAAALNGMLYLSALNGTFAWNGESGELTKLTIGEGVEMETPYFPNLLAQGDALYSLDITAGTLTSLVITGAEITTGEKSTFDNKNLLLTKDGITYPLPVYSAVLLENKLYLLTSTEDTDDNLTRVLNEIDLQTGKHETLLTGTHLSAMTAYKDGNLLIKVFDEEKYFGGMQGEADRPTLTVFDTKQKKLTQNLLRLTGVYTNGIVYDEKTDVFYMMTDGQLFRQTASGKPEAINYIKSDSYIDSQNAMLIGSAQYVTVDYAGVYIRSTDVKDRPSNVLRVSGTGFSYLGVAGYEAFTKAHPEIVVTTVDDSYYGSAEELYIDFLSNTAGDIYRIDDVDVLESVIKKGYCMDLSGNSKLVEAVQNMYPHMTEAFFKGGKLYAVPFTMYVNNIYSYSPSLFERIGIVKADVPDTLMELMDFMVDWVQVYADKYPELDLLRVNQIPAREMILDLIIKQQLVYCQREGIPLTFDTPEIRALLNRLDEVSPIIGELNPDEGVNGGSWSSDDPLTALIDTIYDLSSHSFSETLDYEPMLIGLADDIPMMHRFSMDMLMVNPNTKNPEMAMALLESLMDNMEAQIAYMLYPGRNEPVEDPYYQHNLNKKNEFLKSAEEALAKETDELTIKQLQESIDSKMGEYDFVERYRYTISPEMIARYRAIAPNIRHDEHYYYTFWGSDSLPKLRNRYLDGQLSAEQFVKETEKILQMIHLENQ